MNNKTTANEWARFVSPFLMLAGAEVLYGRMEHVIDPESKKMYDEKNRSEGSKSAKSDREISAHSRGFGLLFLDCLRDASKSLGKEADGVKKPAMVTFDFARESPAARNTESNLGTSAGTGDAASKQRGSRRLISIYQQIRGDLVIVGEYLCDPVLGSLSSNQTKPASGLQQQKIPPLPYGDDGSTSYLKPNVSTRIKEVTSIETDKRRMAAISLRDTLSNLISFIDTRCTLISIHAEICSGCSSASWDGLSKQCESISSCSPVMDRVEKEAKALKLMLDVVKYMEEFK
jgi:hypothetical protein